ncbi:MAG TPA: tRNA lysidine(34) synthetase TilS, partial [Armatimonadota bacterium]|nr:tRNA lysidine(34) synthetase TilS [Armatimonadota bacterium]
MLPLQVAEYIARYGLFAPGEAVLVAVSGGPDSVALLRCLSDLGGRWGLGLSVGHVNHQLRGEESDQDEAFVADLARRLGVAFATRRVDVRSRAAAHGESVEMAARDLRWAALREMASEHGASRVALGHTADDQAETILLNVMRGTGVRGLRGMLPASPDGRVRPFLGVRRREIIEYLDSLGQPYRSDRTNESLMAARNLVRNRLLPVWLGAGLGDPVEALRRLAERMCLDDEALMWAADQFLTESRTAGECVEGQECRIALQRLTGLPDAVGMLVLRRACERVSGGLHGLSLAHVREIWKMVGSARVHARVVLPIGVRASIAPGEVRIQRLPKGGSSTSEVCESVPRVRLNVPGRTCVHELGVVFEAALGRACEPVCGVRHGHATWLRAAGTCDSWSVRPWQPGDRVRPVGLDGHSKKLKKLFQERRIPPAERSRYPVVVDAADTPVWVPGLAADHARYEEWLDEQG